MGSAGYGNHEDAAEAVAEPDPNEAAKKPGGESNDRPGTDLGASGDVSGAQGAPTGSPFVPDGAGTGPHSGSKESGSPTPSNDRRDESTPGAGALPSGPQGGDVDPGAG